MAEGTIRVGIGGWTYPPWRGVFYPDKLAQAKELEYASRALSAIEINATFYGRQSPKSWAAWENVVPEGFHFAVKGSRFCVTRSKLAEGAEGIGNRAQARTGAVDARQTAQIRSRGHCGVP